MSEKLINKIYSRNLSLNVLVSEYHYMNGGQGCQVTDLAQVVGNIDGPFSFCFLFLMNE